MTRVKTTSKGYRSTSTFIIALSITLAIFVGMSLQTLHQYRDLKEVESQNMRLQELSGIIIHLDEVLTMSARMGAATGDLKWEERYLSFEPQLDIAIKKTMELAPETFIGQNAAQTDVANIKLVAMEKQAFKMLHQGQTDAAIALLFSNEYVEQKRIYAEGMKNITNALQRNVKVSIKQHRQHTFLAIVAISIALPFLLFAWIYAIRVMRRNTTMRIKMDEIQRKHSEALEQHVIERTAELEIVNEELKCEAEERKQVATALQESEDKFRSISASANDAIIMLDNDERISYWNEAAERIFGYLKEETLGKNIHSLVIPERYRKKHLKGFERFKATGVGNMIGKTVEVVGIRKDGAEIPIELSLSAVKRNGKRNGQWNAIGLVRDITERKKDEKQLRKLYQAVEQTATSIVITNDEGTIEYVNPRFSKVTGYRYEEAIGKTPRILKSGKHGPEFFQDMWKTITQGKLWKGEIVNKKKNGELYWERVIISPITDENGMITHYVSVQEDITERRKLEKELKELNKYLEQRVTERTAALIEARNKAEVANRAKSRFLANMSHELRTPLNSIIGFSEIIKDKSFGEINEKQEKHLNNINKSGKRLLGMIDDIIDLSRVDAGIIELELEELSIPLILSEAVETVKPTALKKNIQINTRMYGNLLTINADKAWLGKTINILLDNALKFTPDGGKIKLVANRIEDKLQVSVTDTGIGVKPEIREHIFKGFEQADGSYTRKYGGAGIGLTLAKKITELCSGRIWVESPPGEGLALEAGKGSSVVFEIPCKTA